MWAIANTPLRVDYDVFQMTFIENEIFMLAPYEVLKRSHRPITIEKNPDLIESFMKRLHRRLYLIAPPFTAEKIKEVEMELINRRIWATDQAIAFEFGRCRESINKMKRIALSR